MFDKKPRDLQFCSLIVPNLLASAFDLSRDVRFLKEAEKYVLAWSKFKSSLPIPGGYVFTDHAIAARVESTKNRKSQISGLKSTIGQSREYSPARKLPVIHNSMPQT